MEITMIQTTAFIAGNVALTCRPADTMTHAWTEAAMPGGADHTRGRVAFAAPNAVVPGTSVWSPPR